MAAITRTGAIGNALGLNQGVTSNSLTFTVPAGKLIKITQLGVQLKAAAAVTSVFDSSSHLLNLSLSGGNSVNPHFPALLGLQFASIAAVANGAVLTCPNGNFHKIDATNWAINMIAPCGFISTPGTVTFSYTNYCGVTVAYYNLFVVYDEIDAVV